MGLQEYERKRDFRKTPEPPPVYSETNRRIADGGRFVVQKHAARRLHYDLRLELDGVLMSWAVTKGPSLNPADKRLAVRTEDHPLSYAEFEGTIPQGEYGGGTVMLWDVGEWEPASDPHEGLRKGRLSFTLHGRRLHGRWTLVQMWDDRRDSRRENWLLIKDRDESAMTAEAAARFLDEQAYSIKTGRAMEEITARKDGKIIKTLEKLYEVQLATLVETPPQGEEWLHEIKYDGYRLLAFVAGDQVMLRTRNGHDWTDKFPDLRRAFAGLQIQEAVIDLEAVVIDEDGRSNFQALQRALSGEGPAPVIHGWLFDLLYLNGEDWAGKPLIQRKQKLEAVLKEFNHTSPVLHYSDHVSGKGKEMIARSCDMGLEGIISKHARAPYKAGRNKNWLKSKCIQRQEFVIIGYTAAKGGTRAIGALHLGYHHDGRLRYAGKVGSGFNRAEAIKLYDMLQSLATETHPVQSVPKSEMRSARWVKPELLCEVAFAEWTSTGRVRHASYRGLRSDKPAEDITRDKPQPVSRAVDPDLDILGVRISNPQRMLFDDIGVTKGELAEYYGIVAPLMLVDCKNHPLSLLRCPGGIEDDCFYQRSPAKGMGEHIHTFSWEHKNKPHEYLYTDKCEGLIQLVQMGAVEIHPWGASVDRIDYPDRIVFDLDPDESVPFEAVKLAALDMRRRLEALNLQCFIKCTGGKGLHVVIPLMRRRTWPEIKAFAKGFAQSMANDVPEAYTATMSKAQRKGKIFVDYLRNDYTATSIADYAVRARPGAPVAVPLRWEELSDLESASQFTIRDTLNRIKHNRFYPRPVARQRLSQETIDRYARPS